MVPTSFPGEGKRVTRPNAASNTADVFSGREKMVLQSTPQKIWLIRFFRGRGNGITQCFQVFGCPLEADFQKDAMIPACFVLTQSGEGYPRRLNECTVSRNRRYHNCKGFRELQ
jgi:hypothetical protein